MNVIVDYGLGNIESIYNWFKRADMKIVISKDPVVIKEANLLILPGVGAFKDAIEALETTQLDLLIKSHVLKGKPLIGICLGMQLLFDQSYEGGLSKGLGLISGDIMPFKETVKVPHMGWNNLKGHDFFKGEDVYFIHSFYLKTSEDVVLAYAEYEDLVPGVVRKDNVLGFQFHPEKSGDFGEQILSFIKEFKDEYIPGN